jgi:hypothetical protein
MNYLPIVLAPVGDLPDAWFTEPVLPPDVARDEVRRWVDAQLVPLPLAEWLAVRDWEARRTATREALLGILGLGGPGRRRGRSGSKSRRPSGAMAIGSRS